MEKDMKMKQTASYHVSDNSKEAFKKGIEALKKASEKAAQVIEKAEKEWNKKVALLIDARFNDELGLGVAMQLEALYGWCTGDKVSCMATPGKIKYTTDSGLSFGWNRWESNPGYSFFIVHPTGRFPEGSTLLDTLMKQGWTISQTQLPPLPEQNEKLLKAASEASRTSEYARLLREAAGITFEKNDTIRIATQQEVGDLEEHLPSIWREKLGTGIRFQIGNFCVVNGRIEDVALLDKKGERVGTLPYWAVRAI
jgi:hypothetical protein